ncbi:MAG: hypothetical protein O7A06_06255 [Acidobacteria bacterium]|nr:hypothetical protein [Acidobacteriota bacterium]
MTPDIETRLQLAAERLQQLQTEVDAYLADASGRATGGMIPGTTLASIEVRPLDPPPTRLSALVGEVLYHLRSALDFAVFMAALLDSGEEQSDTQFPIVTDEDDWETQAKRRLKHLSRPRQQVVLALQPFRGQRWTERLRDLSNPDKHRHLTVVAAEAEHKLTIKRTSEGFETAFRPNVALSFDDGADVVSSLQELLEKVREAVARLLGPEGGVPSRRSA